MGHYLSEMGDPARDNLHAQLRRKRRARADALTTLLRTLDFGEHDGGQQPVLVQEAAKHLRLAYELLNNQVHLDDLLEKEHARAVERDRLANGAI